MDVLFVTLIINWIVLINTLTQYSKMNIHVTNICIAIIIYTYSFCNSFPQKDSAIYIYIYIYIFKNGFDCYVKTPLLSFLIQLSHGIKNIQVQAYTVYIYRYIDIDRQIDRQDLQINRYVVCNIIIEATLLVNTTLTLTVLGVVGFCTNRLRGFERIQHRNILLLNTPETRLYIIRIVVMTCYTNGRASGLIRCIDESPAKVHI